MGNYNPNIPKILGQEWVPIRDESPLPDVAQEIGHSFVLTSTRSLSQGRFYLSTDAFDLVGSDNPTFLMNLYPQGTEVEVGPIGRVVVPAQSGSISGDGAILGTIQEALATPANLSGGFGVAMSWITASGTTLTVNFGTMAYQSLLYDKRILGLNLLVAACGDPPAFELNVDNASGLTERIGTIEFGACSENPAVKTISLYEVTPHWQTTGTYPSDLQPWRWSELRRFDTTGGAPSLTTIVAYGGGAPPAAGAFARIGYMALEIWYCNETRVAVGCKENGLDGVGISVGTNIVTMRNSSLATPVSIPPDEYTVTVCLADFAGFDDSAA